MREPGEAVLERDRLALLGQLQPAGWVAGGLREDRRMGRPATAARAAAATVEDRQLDLGLPRDLDEPFLRAVDRPLCGEEAAVLAGVGVADHHLEAAVTILHPLRETRIGEQLADDVRRTAEVRDRLEQGNDGEPLVAEIEDSEDVGGGRRAGDDHRVERFRPVSPPDVGGGSQRVVRPRARLAQLARMQPQVELGKMEAEDLDSPPQRCEPAGRDARSPVRRQAAREHVEIREQLGGTVVPAVSESPPDERKLAPIGLELAPSPDRAGVLGQFALVARDRLVQLGRNLHERPMHRERDRKLAHVAAIAPERKLARAVERLANRFCARCWIAVHVAADPGSERER